MDSLKFHPGPQCPTLLRPAGGPPLKHPYNRFWGGSPAGRAARGSLPPFWTPHAVRLCKVVELDLQWRKLRFQGDQWNKLKKMASKTVGEKMKAREVSSMIRGTLNGWVIRRSLWGLAVRRA
jgi:hypothetical protein